jgi:hypothetical protein
MAPCRLGRDSSKFVLHKDTMLFHTTTACIFALSAQLMSVAFALAAPSANSTIASCSAPAADMCAQFHYADGTISQDIHISDGGCTDIRDASLVTGINVFDCWCGLWKYVDFPTLLLCGEQGCRDKETTVVHVRESTGLTTSSAQDSGACNNGYDEKVDQFNACTGMVEGKDRWKLVPTHVSCFRL